MGCPIRKSTDQSLFAAPHGLSQRITSFIACACQGIHQMPFFHLIIPIANEHLSGETFTPAAHGAVVCTGRGSKIRRTTGLQSAPPKKEARKLRPASLAARPSGAIALRTRDVPSMMQSHSTSRMIPLARASPTRVDVRSLRNPKGIVAPASCSDALHAASMPTSTEPAKDQLLETEPDDVRSGNIDRNKHRPFQHPRRSLLSKAAMRTPG